MLPAKGSFQWLLPVHIALKLFTSAQTLRGESKVDDRRGWGQQEGERTGHPCHTYPPHDCSLAPQYVPSVLLVPIPDPWPGPRSRHAQPAPGCLGWGQFSQSSARRHSCLQPGPPRSSRPPCACYPGEKEAERERGRGGGRNRGRRKGTGQ